MLEEIAEDLAASRVGDGTLLEASLRLLDDEQRQEFYSQRDLDALERRRPPTFAEQLAELDRQSTSPRTGEPYKMSLASRMNMSAAKKGRPITAEHRAAIKAGWAKGAAERARRRRQLRELEAEAKRKRPPTPRVGRVPSSAEIAEMSAKMKARWRDPEWRERVLAKRAAKQAATSAKIREAQGRHRKRRELAQALGLLLAQRTAAALRRAWR